MRNSQNDEIKYIYTFFFDSEKTYFILLNVPQKIGKIHFYE